MTADQSASRWFRQNAGLAGFGVALGLLSIAFIAAQLAVAGQRALWLDEAYGLFLNSRGQSAVDLLLRGASGQVSMAPLDYLLNKLLDDARGAVFYFGLSPTQYYRLVPILATAVLTTVAAWLVARSCVQMGGPLRLQLVLVWCGAVVFLTNSYVFYYAAELRPYAVWNSIWLLTVTIATFVSSSRRALSMVLLFLAAAAAASMFQLAALVAGLLLAQRADGGAWSVRELSKVFALPLAVSAFYAVGLGDAGGGDPPVWSEFFSFWLGRSQWVNWFFAILAVATCWLVPRACMHAAGAASVLLLMCAAPAIYGVAQKAGSFSSRHYIPFSVAPTIGMWVLAVAVAPLLTRPRRHALGVVFACVAGVAVAHNLWRLPPRVGRHHTAGLADPNLDLRELLSRGRPAAFRFEEDTTWDGFARSRNVQLAAEWIEERIRDRPRLEIEVCLQTGADGSVVVANIGSSACPHLLRSQIVR